MVTISGGSFVGKGIGSRRVVDLWNTLYLLDPRAAPLWTLVNRLRSAVCRNTKIEWVFLDKINNTQIRECNYCQIFKKRVEITRTLMNSYIYGGTERSYQRRKKGMELLRDFERAMFFGQPNSSFGSVGPDVTTVGGVFYYGDKYSKVKSRLYDMKERTFESGLRKVFAYGSASRYFFCGKLPTFMKSKAFINVPTNKTYGIIINQYLSQNGTLNVIEDPILGNCGAIVDVNSMVLRPLGNRGVFMETERQNPGDDFIRDIIISEWSCEHRSPYNYALMGKPSSTPAGIPQGSSFSTGGTTSEGDDFEYEPTLDEILGLEDPVWSI